MGTKIVLDTNIIISGFGWKGLLNKILKSILDNNIFTLVISYKQINELERVLNYQKLQFTKYQKINLVQIIMQKSIIVETFDKLKIIKQDPDDNIILESALVSGSSYIITGDNHLLRLKQFNNVQIMSPAEFCKKFYIN